VLVTDRRAGEPRCHALDGRGAALLRTLDVGRTPAALANLTADLDPDIVGAALATWEHRRWVAATGRHHVGVVPRRERVDVAASAAA
jgi:hypothetical protein